MSLGLYPGGICTPLRYNPGGICTPLRYNPGVGRCTLGYTRVLVGVPWAIPGCIKASLRYNPGIKASLRYKPGYQERRAPATMVGREPGYHGGKRVWYHGGWCVSVPWWVVCTRTMVGGCTSLYARTTYHGGYTSSLLCPSFLLPGTPWSTICTPVPHILPLMVSGCTVAELWAQEGETPWVGASARP